MVTNGIQSDTPFSSIAKVAVYLACFKKVIYHYAKQFETCCMTLRAQLAIPNSFGPKKAGGSRIDTVYSKPPFCQLMPIVVAFMSDSSPFVVDQNPHFGISKPQARDTTFTLAWAAACGRRPYHLL